MFFTKGGLCSFATRAFLFTIGKKLQLEKIKTKKGLCTNSKSKN